MYLEPPSDKRQCRTVRLYADLVIVGGGMAGACCAITAARAGLKVVLIHDRPVLGGNASSEVRLWILGATSHMGNNNRWAREGGVIDEILVENTFRNPEGNPLIFDLVLLEKVREEPNIELLLNTAAFDLTKSGPDAIESIRAFCSQNSTLYEAYAPLFCDASGDGIVGFLAGAAFRMGAETPEEFGERFAPAKGDGGLLGDSIFFYSKDVGRPVRFIPPSFALQDVRPILRYRRFTARDHGCHLWWIEYGGHLDTVHDTEQIKWELWKVVYGVWNHIKNSGDFPEAGTMTLEWVGAIPGKRESRRFEGDYMLIQQDIVEQRRHPDAVAFGGWAIDLHPAEGVYGSGPSCHQWHSKGVYQIPYRCLYSRNIENLFLAGRLISASHVAFGSSRVMATGAHAAQAVAMAAALCRREKLRPRDLLAPARMKDLQLRLIRAGQYIPGVVLEDDGDLARKAKVTASSSLELGCLSPASESVPLDAPRAMLLPLQAGAVPAVSFCLEVSGPTRLEVQLRVSSRLGNFTPDVILETRKLELSPTAVREAASVQARRPAAVAALPGGGASSAMAAASNGERHKPSQGPDGSAGRSARGRIGTAPAARGFAEPPHDPAGHGGQWVTVEFDTRLEEAQYALVCLMPNPAVKIRLSDQRVTGVLALSNAFNKSVAIAARQEPPAGSGIDAFEFWLPSRRPGGKNFALRIEPPLRCFGPENVTRGPDRPTVQPNAWVASTSDARPAVTLTWDRPQTVGRIESSFDTDFDHPLESVMMGQPEAVMPFCVKHYRITDEEGRLIAEVRDNHQTRNAIVLPEPVTVKRLRVEVMETHGAPAAIFAIRCFRSAGPM